MKPQVQSPAPNTRDRGKSDFAVVPSTGAAGPSLPFLLFCTFGPGRRPVPRIRGVLGPEGRSLHGDS